jgi:hypothetical protein
VISDRTGHGQIVTKARPETEMKARSQISKLQGTSKINEKIRGRNTIPTRE